MASGAATLLGWVEADSVGAGKLNVTYEDVEALTADYFYLPFKKSLQLKLLAAGSFFFCSLNHEHREESEAREAQEPQEAEE